MRDFLEFDHDAAARERAAADPIGKARELNKRDLPKRFYKEATAKPVDGGFAVELDGRPVLTPAKRKLIVPHALLADRIAAEWTAQGEFIDPASMPTTRLSNSVIDGVTERMDEVIADLVKFAGSDLLCYRAAGPMRLVERQTLVWDPVLDWVEDTFGARFLVAEGVMHQTQDEDAIARIAAAVAISDPWRLAAIHSVTTLTGSVLLTLAFAHGRLDADATWMAGMLDDLWSLEVWGHDDEAALRLAQRRREFDSAAAFLAATA